jgi:hypothetical protein
VAVSWREWKYVDKSQFTQQQGRESRAIRHGITSEEFADSSLANDNMVFILRAGSLSIKASR